MLFLRCHLLVSVASISIWLFWKKPIGSFTSVLYFQIDFPVVEGDDDRQAPFYAHCDDFKFYISNINVIVLPTYGVFISQLMR